jgi:hypothetical protein
MKVQKELMGENEVMANIPYGQQVFKLSRPIMVDGSEVHELKYDFDALTAFDKLQVGKASRAMGLTVSIPELDSDYHLCIFAKTCQKANKALEMADVFRMSAKDSVIASNLVRNFFYFDSEDSRKSLMEDSEQ